MNPMYPSSISGNHCNTPLPQYFSAPAMNNFIVPPFNGDVMSSQNSCNTAVSLQVTGIQNTPINDRTKMTEGSVLIFNDTLDKLEWKTIPQIFLDNPALIPAISANVTGLQATAQKGLANGYAGLDTGSKVPVANLPYLIGSTASVVGVAGIVPAPAVNANPGSKVLYDDGTWKLPVNTQILTTKGDLLTRDGSSALDVRLPIGADGTFLVADSTATTGQRWANGSVITVSSPSNLPATLTPNTLYLTTSNTGIYANVAGTPTQINKQFGYTDVLFDSATTGSYNVIVTGNDYIQVAPVSDYVVDRIVNLSTSGVAKGYKVTFGSHKISAANVATKKYIVAAVDFDGASSTEVSIDTFTEFAYTGTQWIRTK
jgi:hypothetical protein